MGVERSRLHRQAWLTIGALWMAWLPLAAQAEAPRRGPVPAERPAVVPATSTDNRPTLKSSPVIESLAWHEGPVRRSLQRVPQWQADFTPRVPPRPVLGRPDGTENPALVSPVLRDESGQLRALPGGVLVVLRSALDETDAQRFFASVGVTPVRQITDTLWLLQAPAGLPALDLSNRLNDSGLFASAQPNWWTPRARK